MNWAKIAVVALVSIVFGCTQIVEDPDFEFGSGYYQPTSSTGDEGEEDGEKFDVGISFDAASSYDPDQKRACTTIDFLFVIDNSGSMGDNQTNIIANFPAFVDGILNNIPTIQDYQVGVVTTDSYIYNIKNCQSIGGLVVKTGGINSSEQQCGPYADGYNFMTPSDDLPTKFACAAQVGTTGSGSEQPLAAMVNSLEGWLNSPGKCNDGFLRSDSVLIVTIITDEDDQSGGTTVDWREHLVWLKAGGLEATEKSIVRAAQDIVVLILANI